MSNILYISNIGAKRMSYSFVGSALEAAHQLGHNFFCVSNRALALPEDIKRDEEKYGVKLLHIDLDRSPFSAKNIKAYKQLCNIIREYKIDYIHCNTPVGGLLGRLAGKKCKVNKVLYQVHGFHFYKGAPKKNWLFYYPVEKWLAKSTDALVTINRDDFDFAKKKIKLRKKGKVYYVPGVGIDTKSFVMDDGIRKIKRAELGISDSDFMIITAGNLDPNKNFDTAIKAVAESKNANVRLFVCGIGPESDKLNSLSKELKVSERVKLLGYRNDMKELLLAADAFIMPTYREGLSRSIMEAMASGLPCIVSKIRGNIDLIEEGKGGFLCSPDNVEEFSRAINSIFESTELREKMKKENLLRVRDFDLSKAIDELKSVYEEVFV